MITGVERLATESSWSGVLRGAVSICGRINTRMNMRKMITLVENVLNELTGYKNDTDFADAKEVIGKGKNNRSALDRFAHFLQQRGFRVIDSGGFGIVFTRSDLPYVIKVFRGDPAYLKFVQYCQRQRDPHLPVFRGKVMLIAPGVYATRMEYLSPFHGGSEMADKIEEFAVSHMSPEEFVAYSEQYGDPRNSESEWLAQNISLLRTIEGLKALESQDVRFDLHAGNFMQRGDTVVVADPFYSKSAYQLGSIPDDDEIDY